MKDDSTTMTNDDIVRCAEALKCFYISRGYPLSLDQERLAPSALNYSISTSTNSLVNVNQYSLPI